MFFTKKYVYEQIFSKRKLVSLESIEVKARISLPN